MGLFKDLTERTIVVRPGEAAILDFPLIESHPSPSVTWQADDNPLPYSQKYADTDSHQLIILSADETDKNAYRLININYLLNVYSL